MTTTPREAKTEENVNPFRKAFTAQIIAKYMSDTKPFRGPDKHVTMHECLENRGELTDQEIVHSLRPAEVTANEERKNILYISVSSLRRLVLCFLKAAINAYHYLSKENIYSNPHIPPPTTKIDLECPVS